jgi:SAM-dependent methyltransferase
VTEAELDRIRGEYEARDAAAAGPYRWDNPGYVAYMQILERAVLRTFRDAAFTLEGARVLDVGCGTGYFLHRLQDYGAGECHCIDLVEERIDEGRKRYPTLQLAAGSATDLPFADGTFDLVTQFTCLSSIIDDDVRLRVSREMGRVAAGGAVLSVDIRRRPRRTSKGRPKPTPTVAIDRRELVRLFGEPTILRRTALAFEIAEITGKLPLITDLLASLPPLQSHLIGLWRRQA